MIQFCVYNSKQILNMSLFLIQINAVLQIVNHAASSIIRYLLPFKAHNVDVWLKCIWQSMSKQNYLKC